MLYLTSKHQLIDLFTINLLIFIPYKNIQKNVLLRRVKKHETLLLRQQFKHKLQVFLKRVIF